MRKNYQLLLPFVAVGEAVSVLTHDPSLAHQLVTDGSNTGHYRSGGETVYFVEGLRKGWRGKVPDFVRNPGGLGIASF